MDNVQRVEKLEQLLDRVRRNGAQPRPALRLVSSLTAAQPSDPGGDSEAVAPQDEPTTEFRTSSATATPVQAAAGRDEAPAVEMEVVELDADESIELADEADVELAEESPEPELKPGESAVVVPAIPRSAASVAAPPPMPEPQASETTDDDAETELDAPTIPPVAGARRPRALELPSNPAVPGEFTPSPPPQEAILAIPPGPAAAPGLAETMGVEPAHLEPVVIAPVRLAGIPVAEFIAEAKATAPRNFGECLAGALALEFEES